jgi:hypothetical protein
MLVRPRQGIAVAAAAAALGLAAPAAAPAQLTLPTLPGLPTLPAVLPTDPAALQALLATLGIDTPAELGDVLAAATPSQLSTLIQGVDPAEIDAALATLTPAELAAVKEQVDALAAQAGAPAAIIALATQLAGGAGDGGSTGGGSTGGGSTGGGSAGGGTTQPPSGGGTTTPTVNTAVRAAIRKAKLAKNRRSLRVTLSCPATAPACGVGIGGTVGARKAFAVRMVTLKSATTVTTKIKLKRSVAKRLRRKGGTLKVVAGTVGSTLGPATKRVRVAKPRR